MFLGTLSMNRTFMMNIVWNMDKKEFKSNQIDLSALMFLGTLSMIRAFKKNLVGKLDKKGV